MMRTFASFAVSKWRGLPQKQKDKTIFFIYMSVKLIAPCVRQKILSHDFSFWLSISPSHKRRLLLPRCNRLLLARGRRAELHSPRAEKETLSFLEVERDKEKKGKICPIKFRMSAFSLLHKKETIVMEHRIHSTIRCKHNPRHHVKIRQRWMNEGGQKVKTKIDSLYSI